MERSQSPDLLGRHSPGDGAAHQEREHHHQGGKPAGHRAGNKGPEQRVSDVLFWEQTVAGALKPKAAGLSKLIYDTEVNYGVAGPGPTPGKQYTDAEGAALIKQTYADSKALGIDGTSWYLYTAAPFSLLGVQLFSGTPLSIAAYNAS